MYRVVVAVLSENDTAHKYTMCGQNTEILVLKLAVLNRNHEALNGRRSNHVTYVY